MHPDKAFNKLEDAIGKDDPDLKDLKEQTQDAFKQVSEAKDVICNTTMKPTQKAAPWKRPPPSECNAEAPIGGATGNKFKFRV